MVNFEINSTFTDLIYCVIMFISYTHKKSVFLNAAFFLCCLEGCEILDKSSKLLRFKTFGCTTLTFVFDNLDFESIRDRIIPLQANWRQMFLSRKFLDY